MSNYLNTILHSEISKNNNYTVYNPINMETLLDLLSSRRFDAYVLNLNDTKQDTAKLLDLFFEKNRFCNVIGYYDNNFKTLFPNKSKIFLIKKPFRLSSLLNYLENIRITNNFDNTSKYLMSHIIFSPSKKTISNLETNKIQHLTEKENNLLIYFYNKKNIEISKKELLIDIWGVSNEVNTHTLETHIYRLKQKLQKIDKHLSYSLINSGGLYCLKHKI